MNPKGLAFARYTAEGVVLNIPQAGTYSLVFADYDVTPEQLQIITEDIKALPNVTYVDFISKEFSLSEKCVPIGMSCGGLQGARFAEEYPELTAVLYLDNPVLNILSMYGLGAIDDPGVAAFRREIINTFNVDDSTILNFRNSPIDKMEKLIENNIPVLLIYGNADPVVIYRENGKVLEDYYKANGGNIKVICRTMAKHHPHGLVDPTPIIEFVEENF